MAFNDLQIKVASETAIMGLQKHMASLKYFAKDVSPMSDRPFAGVQVPVYALSAAAEFDEESNNWCGGTNEVDGVIVGLDKHFIKSIALNDVQAGETDINFLRDGSRAIADVLGHAANKYVWGLINSTNVPLSAEFTGTTKTAFANLFKIADDNGVNPYECVLALNPEQFAKLLSLMDSNVYGGASAVQTGVIESLYGFRAVVCTSYLPEGTIGAIIPYNCLAIVSRTNKPAIDGYVNVWTATTDDGFSIGYRVFEHLCKGKMFLGADVLMGAKVVQDGIIRLVPAA